MSTGRSRLVGGALVLAVLATRLPFVPGTGLGADPDAWRLVLAGRTTAATGRFTLSRPPGYPLLELLAAAVPQAPAAALTAATALVSTLGAGALALLCRDLRVRPWWLPPLGFALTDVVYRASTSYLDYAWSTALLAAALAALAQRRPVTAGVLLGLAVAARPSTGAAGVVVAVVVVADAWWTWRRALAGAGAALVTTAAFYAAPLLRYGPEMITADPQHAGALDVLERATTGVFGLYGVLGVAGGVVLAGARAVRHPRGEDPGAAWWTQRRTWAVALAAGLAVQLAVFVAMPIDPGYLLPAVAMVWLLLGLGLGRRALAVVVATAAVGAFVPAVGTTTVLQERTARVHQVRSAQPLLDRVAALPRGTVVVAGGRLPQLLVVGRVPVRAGTDPAGLAASVPLRTGQVLAHDFTSGDGAAAPVYRVPGAGRVPRWVPRLPPVDHRPPRPR